jgi:hypothetical protein
MAAPGFVDVVRGEVRLSRGGGLHRSRCGSARSDGMRRAWPFATRARLPGAARREAPGAGGKG